MRIAGFNIQDTKRVDIGLTYIYGIGRRNVIDVLKKAQVDGSKRVSALSEDEKLKIQRVLEALKLEGDLRAEVAGNIKRLKEISSYRGLRHSRNLPVRGQRTRSNARTKRGKRVTIGAIKKEAAAKTETGKAEESKAKK